MCDCEKCLTISKSIKKHKLLIKYYGDEDQGCYESDDDSPDNICEFCRNGKHLKIYDINLQFTVPARSMVDIEDGLNGLQRTYIDSLSIDTFDTNQQLQIKEWK